MGNQIKLNFYYYKKGFKIFIACENIGYKIIVHPSYFNIKRYLTNLR